MKDNAKWLSEFYAQVAEGGEIEFANTGDKWCSATCGPDMRALPDCWRIKPALTPIDLSVLIKSGIDCEFSDNSDFPPADRRISYIQGIGAGFLTNQSTLYYLFCRPRMNHWHAWFGGDCPLPEGIEVEVEVTCHDGSVLRGEANIFNWGRNSYEGGDIIAFKVTGLSDGFCWPWEMDK